MTHAPLRSLLVLLLGAGLLGIAPPAPASVLPTATEVVPRQIAVALPTYMHYSLGQVRDAHAGDDAPTLVLLKGERFKAAHEAGFLLDLSLRERVLQARGER